mgnify:CR=1 FL=1
MLITELFDLTEVKIDNQNGAGATPDNANIDYKGLRVLMRPSVFLKLAAPLNMPHSEKLEAYIAQGGAIASPMLIVDIPEAWEQGDFQPLAQVTDHEGRNRASVILKLEGDEPIEVHLFPRYFRHRHITDQWIEALNRGLHVQRSQQVLRGPLFSPQLVDEGWREKTAAAMAAATMGWGAYNAANQPPPGVEPVATAAPIAQHRANEPQFTDRIPLRDVLVRHAREAGIQGQELLHLIAQAAHETANWRHMEEQPPQGARNPQKYFSKKYDNRKILANKRPGDGYRYRGRGARRRAPGHRAAA